MEIKVLEDTKKKLVFEIKGESHGLANALKDELYNDKSVAAAGYFIEHPEIGVPNFVLETDGKKEPKKALDDAVKRLKKKNKDTVKLFTKELK